MKKSYKNISEFIDMLDAAGELVRIKDEVSPIVEISKYADAESKKPDGGKALLFENVVDNGRKSFPVAVNLFGSDRRMSAALGIERLADAGREIAELTEANPPKSFADFWDLAKKTLPLARILPKKFRGRPPCQEVVKTGKDIDLSEIPVLKCWPHDGGRFITLPLVFTKSPDGKKRNLGMYRLQVYDADTTGMHWHDPQRRLALFQRVRKSEKTHARGGRNRSRPRHNLRGDSPHAARNRRASSGGLLPQKRRADGKVHHGGHGSSRRRRVRPRRLCGLRRAAARRPFGDHTGYYSLADMYPVFHLTAITRKEKPIYCATLVGPPPMEDCYMAKATERVFLPLLKTVMPEIKEYFLPWEGVFHNIAVVSIEKEFPAHAQKLASGLWGQGQMSFCKSLTVVDESVDPSDLRAVWRKFVESFDPKSDAMISSGVLDALDHSAPNPLHGAKIAIDLTKRTDGEAPRSVKKLSPADESSVAKIGGVPESQELPRSTGSARAFLLRGTR